MGALFRGSPWITYDHALEHLECLYSDFRSLRVWLFFARRVEPFPQRLYTHCPLDYPGQGMLPSLELIQGLNITNGTFMPLHQIQGDIL